MLDTFGDARLIAKLVGMVTGVDTDMKTFWSDPDLNLQTLRQFQFEEALLIFICYMSLLKIIIFG